MAHETNDAQANVTDTPKVAPSKVPSDEILAGWGLVWSTESVNKQPGGNASSKKLASNDAQILVIDDSEKFFANFPDAKERMRAVANSTSVRVMSQGVTRDHPELSRAQRRQMVWEKFIGARSAGRTTTVTVEKIVEVSKGSPLPDGTFYVGDDLTRYQQDYLAQLTGIGLPIATAQAVVKNLVLAK